MLLFGHRFIESEKLYHISDIDAIVHTPNSSTIYLLFSEENLDIIQHAKKNSIPLALGVSSIKELIYASSLGARYILPTQSIAKTAQSIAESYLFDAKIIVMIENESEIEEMALLGIDGVLFSDAIIKINS